jgi:hypothetical protein
MYYNVTFWRVHGTIVAVEKQLSFTYSECVSVPLVIQHAMCMRHVVSCGLPPFYSIFPYYLIKGTLLKKKLFSTKCVF